MIRKIVHVNRDACNGCGLCAKACHEGAIAMIDGKAKLIRDDYCDGLGDCLPACPTGAITFVEREAAAYDAEAVKKHMDTRNVHTGGCPGTALKSFVREEAPIGIAPRASALRQWPVQIKLVPPKAPYFENANLLIAADCAAYAYGDFHKAFMNGKIVLIGCPKLDSIDYSEKLTEILRENSVKSLTVVRMEVPCCSGIEQAAVSALKASGKFIPWQVVTLSADGRILE